jgi:hypothetical protein
MGIRDELKQAFGEEFFQTQRWGRPPNWFELCVCGHRDRSHGPSIGGTFLDEEDDRTIAGRPVHYRRSLDGCAGAMTSPSFERETDTPDLVAGTMTVTINATCLCLKFQPVAKVDRPGRMFNQRIPLDRTSYLWHPFMTGVRAFNTFLSRRKDADPDRGGDPSWVDQEFERRFTWLDRRCAHLTCHTTDGVWPTYVDGQVDRSELRCAQHR